MADHSHRIALAEAVRMVARARQGSGVELKGWQFSSEIINEILNHPEAAGLRFYMARNDAGAQTLVVVGTDADGKDVIGGAIGELAFPCPPFCDDASPFFEP